MYIYGKMSVTHRILHRSTSRKTGLNILSEKYRKVEPMRTISGIEA